MMNPGRPDSRRELFMPEYLSGARIIDALAVARVEYVAAVPDIVTARGVLVPLSDDDRFKLIRVCKEDECIGIAAALAVCGKRAVCLFQNTGFLDSINAIAHLAVQYDLPIVMAVGLLGHDAGTDPRHSGRTAVRLVQPILDAMEIESLVVDVDRDAGRISERIEAAYAASKPVAFLIGRRPAP
jgi:sulfopyruvate decarboxylase subunit alpha